MRLLRNATADAKECQHAIDYIWRKYDRIDGLVNNAGANDGVGHRRWRTGAFLESLRQHLVHYYSMAHYALPLLKQARGAIVNISSKVALTGQGGTSAYAAAKGGEPSAGSSHEQGIVLVQTLFRPDRKS